MARSTLSSCSNFFRAVFGAVPSEKVETVRLVDQALVETRAPTSKRLVEEQEEMVAQCKLSLIGEFPAAAYVAALFDPEACLSFPAADVFVTKAEVSDKRRTAGLPHNDPQWLGGEIWSSEAVEVFAAHMLAAAARRRYGAGKATGLLKQAQNAHAKACAEVGALINARRLAVYNTALAWCGRLAEGREADERTSREMSGVIAAEKAATSRKNATRGKIDPVDEIRNEISELRKTIQAAAEAVSAMAQVRQAKKPA